MLYSLPQFANGNDGDHRVRAPDGGGAAMPTSLTWTESSRTSASEVITDSASDTHTVAIATQIVMTASNGGTSYSWTFQFDNPT